MYHFGELLPQIQLQNFNRHLVKPQCCFANLFKHTGIKKTIFINRSS